MVCFPDVGETLGSTPSREGRDVYNVYGVHVFNSSIWEVKFILNYITSLKLDYVRYSKS